MYVLFSEHGVLQQSLFGVVEHTHTGYFGAVFNARK
jgi:hypothetical protein